MQYNCSYVLGRRESFLLYNEFQQGSGRILNGPMSQSEHGHIFFKSLTSSAKDTETFKGFKGQKYVTYINLIIYIKAHQEKWIRKKDRVN